MLKNMANVQAWIWYVHMHSPMHVCSANLSNMVISDRSLVPLRCLTLENPKQIGQLAVCHQKSLTSKIIESVGRQTHNKSELHCNLKLSSLAKQEPNFKFAAVKFSKYNVTGISTQTL